MSPQAEAPVSAGASMPNSCRKGEPFMDMDELDGMPTGDLLRLWGNIMRVLRDRNIIRSRNVVGDIAEGLVCERLGLRMAENLAQRGYDATDGEGYSYQIKGRVSEANYVAFGSLHGYEERGFDYLILVVFHENFQVRWAVRVPYAIVDRMVRYNNANQTWYPYLNRPAMEVNGVEDIGHLFH